MELIRLEVKDNILRYSKQGPGGRDWANVQLSNLEVYKTSGNQISPRPYWVSQFTVRPKGSGGLNISFVRIPWIACVSAALSWAEVSWLTSSGIRIYFQIEARFQLPAFLSFLMCSPEDYPFPHSVTPAQVRPEQEGKLPLGNCDLLHKTWQLVSPPVSCCLPRIFSSSFPSKGGTQTSEEKRTMETSQWINSVKTLTLFWRKEASYIKWRLRLLNETNRKTVFFYFLRIMFSFLKSILFFMVKRFAYIFLVSIFSRNCHFF